MNRKNKTGLDKSIPVEKLVSLPKPDKKCGQILLKNMIDNKATKLIDEDGGTTTYLRYDAVVKFCNQNFIYAGRARSK